MTSPSIRVEGADALRKALRNLEDGTKDLKAAHLDAAEIVATDARPRARRKSGRMAASVRAAGQAKQGVVRAGFAALPYVSIQHFGHPARNISPNPFLYDALDARSSQVVETYEKHVDNLITKHGLV